LRSLLPVAPLTVAMIRPGFGTVPIPAISAAVLMEPGLPAASAAAIALAMVAARAKIEHRPALIELANPLPQNHFVLNRHLPSEAGLDNGNGFVSP
jgi:hypothetical protein